MSNFCSAQDSILVRFRPITAAITQESQTQLNKFFKDRIPEKVLLSVSFSDEGDASKNRILAELRIFIVKRWLLERGVPFNIIFSTIEKKAGDGFVNVLAFFKGNKEERVLKKSDIVQISEIEFYKPQQQIESPKTDSVQLEEKEVVLDPAAFKKDATVSLPNLIFQGSSHYFIGSSERVLRALLKVMQSRPDIKIELQGHVCCNPPGVDGWDKITGRNNLSVMRARAVYEYLLRGGIQGSRMTYKGFGSSHRLYPYERNETEKMLNRRVEVLITESDE